MKLEVHVEASEEFYEASAYYGNIDIPLGDDFIEEVQNEIAAILANPLIYNIRSNGFRRANLDRFPFYLPFMIEDETVYILAVAHISRRPNYWTHRTSSL